MGFPVIFIQWIKECNTAPMFSVKINGSSVGYFAARRGVRQWDPLSPHLFVLLSIEVLSQLLNRAVSEGIIDYHPQCSKVKLTHLCFANDLIIFTAATNASMIGVKHALDKFYSLSGLEVSYPKSEFFSSGHLLEISTSFVILHWS